MLCGLLCIEWLKNKVLLYSTGNYIEKNVYVHIYVKVKLLSRVRLFATPWTVAHQAPPSMGFSRQEYWEWVAISFSFKLYEHQKHFLKSHFIEV